MCACGVCALFLVVLLLAKIILFPLDIRKDMRNSILASVSATLFMSLMQIATYLAPFAYLPAFVLWGDAVAAHAILIVWFTARFITKFKLNEVFPTYFICYVGIVVASATAAHVRHGSVRPRGVLVRIRLLSGVAGGGDAALHCATRHLKAPDRSSASTPPP